MIPPNFQHGQTGGSYNADPYFREVVLLIQGDGASIADASAYRRTLTVAGSALSTTQTKHNAKSISFNGSNQSVSCAFASELSFASNDLTIEAWVYMASNTGTWHTVLAKNAGPAAPSGMMRLLVQPGRVFFSISSTDYDWSSAPGMTLSAWHHVAVTKQGQNLRGFVDGVMVGSSSSAVSSIPNYFIGFRVGTQQDGDTFDLNGYADGVRVTNRIARYTADFTPPAGPFTNF
jgi:hypothetical protein